MRAKFVYESMGDILKPKSEEEIISSMENMDPDELLLKSSEMGFLPGVKKALEMGADIYNDNDWALRNGHYEVVELLKKYM